MSKKKRITEKDFQRKIQVWTIVITLIVTIIGSLTAIGVAYLSRPKTEYVMSQTDQLEVNKLSAQIDLLAERFFATQDQNEKEKLNAELIVLAEAEASIMRRYNPHYRPRWPFGSEVPEATSLFLLVLAALITVFLSAHSAVRRILSKRYRGQLLDAQIIERIRHHPHGANTSEVIDYIHKAHSHYKPKDIEHALRRLEAGHEIQIHEEGWSLMEDGL